jgi:hypothetical protein
MGRAPVLAAGGLGTVRGAHSASPPAFYSSLCSDWETLGLQMLHVLIYYLLLSRRVDNYCALDILRARK